MKRLQYARPASEASPLRNATLAIAPVNDRPSWLPPRGARLAALSTIKRAFPYIGQFLDASIRPIESSAGPLDGVVGWGSRLPARLVRAYADARGLPFWNLEDGPLRSVGLGKQGAHPVSIVADDIGLPSSPFRASRLEFLLANEASTDLARARSLRELIVRERLTKYNHLPDKVLRLSPTRRRRILLVDQVIGDGSLAGTGPESFAHLWAAARAEPNAELVIKIHPDVAAGAARGYLADFAYARHAVTIADQVSPHAILDIVDEVWTVSSQLGLDALLRGMRVVTFGAPAYAGWGLTEDRATDKAARAAFARRGRRLSIDQYVDAALIRYPIYRDPVAGTATTPEHAAQRLIAWRKRALEFHGRYLCVGFARHKQKVARAFLEGPWSRVEFAKTTPSTRRLKAADHVVVWGDGRSSAQAADRSAIYAEDGFVRSVGLGSDKVPPSSICLDRSAPYFDATRESDLERLLNTAEFGRPLMARAARLRDRIVTHHVTKYNLPGRSVPRYAQLAGERRIVLVAAQVPDDASLRLGRPLHRSNLALLAAVRCSRPHDFIIYKDHPDLVSGNRPGLTDDSELRRLADVVDRHASADALLPVADEIHVATSLLGFEGLIRRRPVFCHGVPFYAGWGLTNDLVAPPRTRRRLMLDELIAGALIVYPRYFSWRSGLPCEAEDIVAECAGARADIGLLQQAFGGSI